MVQLRRWEWVIIAVMVVAVIAAVALISQGGKPVEVADAPTTALPPPTPAAPSGSAAPSSTQPAPTPPAPPGTVPTGPTSAFGPSTAPVAQPPHPSAATASSAPPSDSGKQCARNLKQLSLGLLMYCQDYDERLFPAPEWCTVVEPYVRNRELFRCPSSDRPYGYAFNSTLSRITLAQATIPAATVALFDSTAGRANAADAGRSLCRPPRHPEGNYIAYLDGHVKAGDPHQGFGLTSP